ncbi:hypothetical protein MFLO_10708 [Listeria floridensis FSL S10-1187]|uniref:Uncharacterized protein n=1 Tax=Listeria floridensis FSL S10-1187 TaxID=1265817 RepID=A0ABN0RDV0_9LIST|nr:hypothetical protein [Listeria floridensis]EUJ30287.1 hypothetical protein MFLO_10708 [Listeria floridensis FSL S10-1187]
MQEIHQALPDRELVELEKEVKELLLDFKKEKIKSDQLLKDNQRLQNELNAIRDKEAPSQNLKNQHESFVGKQNVAVPEKPFLRAVERNKNQEHLCSVDSELTKANLAEILIEVQTAADQIVKKAEKKASDILFQKQKDFQKITEQVEQYQEKVMNIKHMNDHLFDKCMDQLDEIMKDIQ